MFHGSLLKSQDCSLINKTSKMITRILILSWLGSSFFVLNPVDGNALVGVPHFCSHEGAQVKVSSDLLGNNSCLICYCRNHTVECNNPLDCPSSEGCYRLQRKQSTECCRTCLGCLLGEDEVPHGLSRRDGCHAYECQAGVLTSYEIKCHTPCLKPEPPEKGHCCPRCKGCWLDSKPIPEGGFSSPRLDPCVRCSCKNGQLTCEKKSCPILSCPPNKAIQDKDGCCQTCNGSREILILPKGHCFLGLYVYHSGDNRTYDECSTCTCLRGFLTCHRQTCPPLQCPERYRQTKPGQCCPECVYPALEHVCVHNGVVKEHGDVWHLDQCKSCSCDHGRVTCQVDHCDFLSKDCPIGFKKVKSAHDCCPRCVEQPGVCITYGDPHYKTFDGYNFNFQGECRYELTRDCDRKVFSVRVNNDARRSSYFSWTRSLSLKVKIGKHHYKVSLGQKLRSKVDRRKVKIPFEENGLNITREGYSLVVNTPIGLKVVWDGASYVEVEVQPEWRNRTCGLCGNFNQIASDDMKTKKGQLAKTDEEMASSWQSGKTVTCSRRVKRKKAKEDVTPKRTQRLTCLNSPSESSRRCLALNNTQFAACRQRGVSIENYLSSCMLDLCECPSYRMCECDSLLAFKRECGRVGVNISHEWNVVTKCGGFECPYGSMYMDCAPACKPTCKNPTPNFECYMDRCKPGCYCPPSTVLHRGSCILPDKCPRTKKGNRKLINSEKKKEIPWSVS